MSPQSSGFSKDDLELMQKQFSAVLSSVTGLELFCTSLSPIFSLPDTSPISKEIIPVYLSMASSNYIEPMESALSTLTNDSSFGRVLLENPKAETTIDIISNSIQKLSDFFTVENWKYPLNFSDFIATRDLVIKNIFNFLNIIAPIPDNLSSAITAVQTEFDTLDQYTYVYGYLMNNGYSPIAHTMTSAYANISKPGLDQAITTLDGVDTASYPQTVKAAVSKLKNDLTAIENYIISLAPATQFDLATYQTNQNTFYSDLIDIYVQTYLSKALQPAPNVNTAPFPQMLTLIQNFRCALKYFNDTAISSPVPSTPPLPDWFDSLILPFLFKIWKSESAYQTSLDNVKTTFSALKTAAITNQNMAFFCSELEQTIDQLVAIFQGSGSYSRYEYWQITRTLDIGITNLVYSYYYPNKEDLNSFTC